MYSLCELKTFRYDGSHLPQYENENIRRLYLLRYLPAYVTEYYTIYKDIMNINYIDSEVNILSIGSGCALDYYGAYFASLNNRLVGEDIRYTGIDKTEWDYRINLGNKEINFYNQDIGLLDRLYACNYNVIIFPKSIGEFDSQLFLKIKTIFRNSRFSEKKVFLVSSIRDQRKDFDANRFSEIVDIMTTVHLYKTNDDPRRYFYFPEKRSLCQLTGGFTYPDHIKDFITSLSKKCPNYKKNGNKSCEPDCSEILDRNPILTNSYMCYQIVRLSRN